MGTLFYAIKGKVSFWRFITTEKEMNETFDATLSDLDLEKARQEREAARTLKYAALTEKQMQAWREGQRFARKDEYDDAPVSVFGSPIRQCAAIQYAYPDPASRAIVQMKCDLEAFNRRAKATTDSLYATSIRWAKVSLGGIGMGYVIITAIALTPASVLTPVIDYTGRGMALGFFLAGLAIRKWKAKKAEAQWKAASEDVAARRQAHRVNIDLAKEAIGYYGELSPWQHVNACMGGPRREREIEQTRRLRAAERAKRNTGIRKLARKLGL
jgi:hypothetical protein